MENDLISRSALLKRQQRYTEFDEAGFSMTVKAVEVEEIQKAPAVDAVEVVRCKDCAFYDFGECGNYRMDMSDGAHFYPYPNDFCSYGERKADDD